jgi:hypothetical protein
MRAKRGFLITPTARKQDIPVWKANLAQAKRNAMVIPESERKMPGQRRANWSFSAASYARILVDILADAFRSEA